MSRASWAASLIGVVLGTFPGGLLAQVTSEIVRDGSVGNPDPALQPRATSDAQGRVVFEIDESLGERPGAGPNLFHSFSIFDLGAGDRAIFSADPALRTDRVLSRVTGGRPSLLHGALESRIPGADFYFLNPAGIVFGPGATLDVEGSVIATTANAIQFAEGKVFSSDPRSPAPLLSAPGVEAFGFLERPGSIDVMGARLAVRSGETLALVGGDLSFDRAQLTATSGRIDLASVGSSGRVRWSDGAGGRPALLGVEDFATLGNVALRSTNLLAQDVSGRAGGIRIDAGALRLDASFAGTNGFGAGAAGTIDVGVHELVLAGSTLDASGFQGAAGGLVRVRADQLRLAGGSRLFSSGFDGGDAGAIDVSADVLALEGASSLVSEGSGGGPGRIAVRGGEVALAGASSFSAAGFFGGPGGEVQVDAGSVRLAGGSRFFSSAFDGGDAGAIDVSAGSLALDGSFLQAEGVGGGSAGSIAVRGGEIDVVGASSLSAVARGGGAAGHIGVNAERLRLTGGSRFDTSVSDGGAGGTIDLRASSLGLDGSFLVAGSVGGRAGRIQLSAGDLVLSGMSSVSASAGGRGEAGVVALEARSLRLVGSSSVLASGFTGSSAGLIDAAANSLSLESGSFFAAEEGTGGSSLGRIVVRAGDLSLSGAADISVAGFGGADAGSIVVEAGDIRVSSFSEISAVGFGGGDAGSIDVTADSLRLNGGRIRADSPRIRVNATTFLPGGSGGDIVVRARDVSLAGAIVVGLPARTDLDVSGSGGTRTGRVRVFADTLRVADRARIMAVGFERRGSDVEIDVGRLLLTGGGQINSGSTDGPAGSISITARDLVEISNLGAGPFSIARGIEEGMGGRPVDFGGVFAASGRPGSGGTRGGDISISAPEIRIIEGGFVATASFGATDAADIRLAAERILITGGGGLDSSAGGAGAAGSVELTASERILLTGQDTQGVPSRIRSITVSSGAAGDIVIRAPTVEIDGGAVTTATLQAADGAGGGPAGNVHLDTGTLVLSNGGRIDSSSFSTATGGRVDVRASERLEIRGKESGISARAASDGDGGSIHVATPDLSLSDGASISSESNQGLGSFAPFVRDAAEAGLFVAPPDTPPDGAAGSIALDVSIARLSGGSRISTRAAKGSDPGAPTGGNIDLTASAGVELGGESEITASVADGRGGDIRIATPGSVILRDRSRIVAQAEGGDATRFRQGGRIDIAAGVFLQEASSLVSADAGQGVSGSVSINAPEVDLESELTRLPVGFLDAAALFKPRCAAAAERADASSFVLAARAVVPPSPEEWLVAFGPDPGSSENTPLPDVAASKRAVELAEAAGDAAGLAASLGRLGNGFLGLEDPQLAEKYLSRGLELARAHGAQSVAAALLNDVGNARAARGAHAEALALYLESAQHASGAAVLRARANAARAALAAGDPARAAELAEQIDLGEPREQPLSREEIDVLIHLGVTERALAERLPERREPLLLRANRAFEQAAAQATARGDFGAASYALGNRGGLYESEHRAEEGLELTRQALAAAERDGSRHAQVRWHAQLGRLLWAQGRANDALHAQRRAVRMLRESRHELAYTYGRGAGKFGDSVGPVYRDLVATLLAASSLGVDPQQAQALLLEARDSVEQLKAAELRDYFRDDCLAELESRSLPLDAVSKRSAVVYPIVLPDRLEILLTLASGVKRYTVPVSGTTLAAETLRFRKQLGEYATSRYLESSWRLYDWLVRPYAADLAEADVQTLVFVTGGPLRTIPLGALHDRKRFLLESYAVAVTPGLALTDPRPLELTGRKLLLAGISESVQGFSALPSVDAELHAIEGIYGGTLLLDESFTSAALREKLAADEFSAVHLASHARFTGAIDDSFLLAYDGPMSIRELGESVRATRFRERPLELLVMSACETAVGDEQAALGLAGVALKAGARSAVGSLWSLNDRSATELMSGFYRALGTPGVSKAEALRRAQLALIRKGAHPYFWSPFLVIGNWL